MPTDAREQGRLPKEPPQPRVRDAEAAYLRAENEDDDGYDPYSDRREVPPLFEPDPWK